ncbi:MAG: FKBP-type peptidyl-prolyl cis-trans isomerase [Bacteroidota bacterium]
MNLNKITFSAVLLVSLLAWGCNNEGGNSVTTLGTNMDSVSYAIGKSVGTNLGQQLQQQGTEPNVAALAQGISDAIQEADGLMTDEEVQSILMAYSTERQAAMQQEMMAKGQENQAAADAFLAANKDKEGVIVHESGLQYEVLQEGTGATPTVDDQVKIHYHGTLLDGTVFDSSVDRGEPVTFALTGLIKAWQIAVPLMKEGAKYRIYSPPGLAYGEQGPPSIGPNAALIFDIELIEVVK